jgi:glycosyltransferase involved in cell wall biosynthesis
MQNPQASKTSPPLDISIVMPCLNEAETLGQCIADARIFLERSGLSSETIVADNGSSDGSQAIATEHGARLVSVSEHGYGAALKGGINAARGTLIIMGDSDASYDFSSLNKFVEKLNDGADLVIGNRFVGGIAPGAMPILHRYLGNPMLSTLARMIFRVPVRDIYCGLRGFTRAAVEKLDLQSDGMEFALEMVVKAKLMNMRIAEVPTTLTPDGRSRPPHLRTWQDGIRSLRFYFLCSPQWVFLYPGLAILLMSLSLGSILVFGPLRFGSIELSIHTLVYCGFGILIGFQTIAFALYAQALATGLRLIPVKGSLVKILSVFRTDAGLLTGAIIILLGIFGLFYVLSRWQNTAFAQLDPFEMMRVVVPSAVALALGIQIVFVTLYLNLVKFQFWKNLDRP